MNVGPKSNKNTSHKAPLTGTRFKSRTVYISSNGTCESTNWRLDLYRVNKMSYAQVLKTAITRKIVSTDQSCSIPKVRDVVSNNKTSIATDKHSPSRKVLPKSESRSGLHRGTAKLKK